MEDKIEKIEEVEKVSSSSKSDIAELIVEEPQRVPANAEHFRSLLGQDAPQTVKDKAEGISGTSLMDQVKDLNTKVEHISRATPAQLANQARSVIAQIENVKTKLATPNLELKDSVQTLLKNKLSHIDESLKVALSRAGVEYTPPPAPEAKITNPIEKFIGYLTHGQYQLNNLAKDVDQLHHLNKELAPADMLALQIKVGYITQEIEFFTNLLNSALSGTKTIMNVQV